MSYQDAPKEVLLLYHVKHAMDFENLSSFILMKEKEGRALLNKVGQWCHWGGTLRQMSRIPLSRMSRRQQTHFVLQRRSRLMMLLSISRKVFSIASKLCSRQQLKVPYLLPSLIGQEDPKHVDRLTTEHEVKIQILSNGFQFAASFIPFSCT